MESDDADATTEYVVVLDVFRHGRQGDDRRCFDVAPIAYAFGESDFHLLELTLAEDADASIGDRLIVPPVANSELIQSVEEPSYGDLSNMATAEVDYVVEDIVEADEQRFIDFYNGAQLITLWFHQPNLLPDIGKKLRDKILESRRRQGPFESFEDLETRVSGFHRPKKVIVKRILDELHDNDVKYRTLVGRGGQ